MPRTGSFLRQLSGKESWKSSSNRWGGSNYGRRSGEYGEDELEIAKRKQMELGLGMYGNQQGMLMMRKRVMVVVDESCHSKQAMMWALTHVTDKGDLLSLLHILPPNHSHHSSSLASSLAQLCKACKPEVEIEAVVVQGPKIGTIMSQVKKLEVSVLVLGQKKPSSLLMNCLFGERRSNGEEIVEECINTMECLTIGVRKQSKSVGGYLISTRWQKNFWLLA